MTDYTWNKRCTADEYIQFFTDPASECEAVFAGDGSNGHSYPDLMNRFRRDVLKASHEAHIMGAGQGKPVWSQMREKYFQGEDYVEPERMIAHLRDFSKEELAAFLHYCVIYKEGFCDGTYGDYVKEGLIGQILLRMKELLSASALIR